MKDHRFATAQKVKLAFLSVGVMDDAIMKVFNSRMKTIKKWSTRKSVPKAH
ncbi:hypothetical protein [Arcticibacter tournemirensis]|uniref:hypothetical protein n=1 Tax=Arcticibacter tournemirensis TaxID=699437 RepID=UPI0013876141|nr:hypothetical protein [Arcticibacter tournemirensis]